MAAIDLLRIASTLSTVKKQSYLNLLPETGTVRSATVLLVASSIGLSGGLDPPSARFDAGNPRPIGFQDSPSAEHIDLASEALAALATEIGTGAGGTVGSEEIRLCLCSVRFVPGTPFQLYGFHVVDVGTDGEFTQPDEEGYEVRYALVVNHPAELQVEAAVLFEALERHRVISAAREADDVSQVDLQAAEADAVADREFLDLARFGWREAAAGVVRKAAEIGVRVSVRYQRDPFHNREELARRMPLLRATYNEIDTARRAVDNTVSAIGGSYPHVRFGGGRAGCATMPSRASRFSGCANFRTRPPVTRRSAATATSSSPRASTYHRAACGRSR